MGYITHPRSTTFTHNALLSSSSTVSNNNPLLSNRIRQTDDSTWITDRMEWVLTIQPPTSPSAHLNISMCTLCGGHVAAGPKRVQNTAKTLPSPAQTYQFTPQMCSKHRKQSSHTEPHTFSSVNPLLTHPFYSVKPINKGKWHYSASIFKLECCRRFVSLLHFSLHVWYLRRPYIITLTAQHWFMQMRTPSPAAHLTDKLHKTTTYTPIYAHYSTGKFHIGLLWLWL